MPIPSYAAVSVAASAAELNGACTLKTAATYYIKSQIAAVVKQW